MTGCAGLARRVRTVGYPAFASVFRLAALPLIGRQVPSRCGASGHVSGVLPRVAGPRSPFDLRGPRWQPTSSTCSAHDSRPGADLTVYLRQHHAERDLALLGELVTEHGAAW